MKKNSIFFFGLLLFVQFLFVGGVWGQNASQYSFSQTNGTYNPLVSPTILGSGSTLDNNTYTISSSSLSGFTFNFCGVNYTTFTVSANGFIGLGSSLMGGTVYTPLSSTSGGNVFVSAYSDDLGGLDANTQISWKLEGISPNRELVVEYKNIRNYARAGVDLSFQIRLVETTNIVKIIYGNMIYTSTTADVSQVGLKSSATTSHFNNRSTSTNWNSTISGTLNSSTCSVSNTITMPVSGLTYIWSIPTCYVPTALASSSITTQAATIAWTAPATGTTPSGYDYEVRTSGAAGSGATGLVVSGTTTAPTTSATISGLSAATTYSYYVRSNCGGGDFSSWTSAGTFVTACDIPSNPGAISVSGSSSTGFTLTYAAASPVPTSYVLFNTTGTSTAATTIPTLVNGATYISGTAYTLGGTSYNCTSTSSTSPQSLSGGVSNTQYNYFLFSRNATNSCSGNPYYSSGITVSAVTCPAAPTSTVNSSITTSGATISWTASLVGGGYGTVNYSLEVYTDAGYTAAISGSPFSMGTNVSQVLSGLAGSTTYFYRIVATNGVCNSGFLTGSFTTLCIAETAPTSIQTFATFTGSAPSPICWTEASSSSVTTSTTLTIANSEWLNSSGFANTGSNVGVKTNLYGTDSDDWLISNQIDLGNTAGVYRLKYDMAVTSFNGSVSQTTIGTHIVRVIISTDGGTTWSSANTLKTYTGAGTYSNTGVTEYVNLSSYSGIIKIAFVATTSSNSPDIDFHLDNFAVETIPPPSITSFTPSQACVSGGQLLTLTGTNFNTITSVLFAGSSGAATLNGTIVSQTATTALVVIPPNFVDGTIKIVNAIGNSVSATNLVALALPSASVSSSSICSGNNAVFAITGTANAVVTYNLNSGSNTTVTLDGSGNGSVTVTAPSTNQTINLVSVNLASTGCTKTLGTSATISLNAVTSITTQPTNQSAQIGANASFSLVANGTALTYQWQEFDGTTYTDISGATSSTLTITSVSANDNGRIFRCVVTGTCGSQNTSNATLTASSIGITTQPADATICSSGSTTLTMVTSGTITNYQWQISNDNQTTWSDVSGATNATLALSGLSYSSPTKVYRCNLNNGTLYTNGATVSVFDQVAISSQPSSQTICTGTSSVSFSVTATGSNPTYQWQVSSDNGSTWANVASGGSSATYTISNPADALNGSQYKVIVTGSSPCTAVTSNAVTLNVIYASIASSVTSGCINSAFALTATLNGNPTSPTYSWACPTTGSGATSAITSNPASITATATGSFVYTLTAGSTECPTITKTISLVVNSLPTITTVTASPSSVCSGAEISLTGASVPSNSGTSVVGAGSTTSSTYPNPFYTNWGHSKNQYLILASELTAAGITPGNITSIAINITSGTSSLTNFSIQLGHSSLSSLSSFDNVSSLTSVYSNSTLTPVLGLNTLTFSTPFNWNGTSNLLIQTCFGNANTTTVLSTATVDNTSFVSCAHWNSTSTTTSSSTCSQTTLSTTYSIRPRFTFNAQVGTNQTSSLTWSWNSTPAIATATGSTTETNTSGSATTKTYTVTATNATTGCVNTATTSAITINPVTVAPSATNSSQCGTATPTCSVTGTGTSGNSFKWYLAATGGTALVGQTANTLSSYPVSATTSFYVSESNGTCESTRVQVTATATAAPAITATASVNPVCIGSATSLNATSANTGYSYVWNNSAGNGATISVNPTSAITYTVTGTDNSGGANNGCVSSASIALTTNPLPSAISLTPSTSTNLCMGDIKSIVASGGSGAVTTVSSISANAGTINLAIPDYNTSGISNTQVISNIPTGATITKVDVTFSLNHAWLSDAEVLLKAPNGKIIALVADQGPSASGSYNNVVITSDNTATALSTSTSTITGTYKANATAAGTLYGSFGSNLTQTFSDLFTTPNGNWIISAFDDGSGDLGTLNSWSIVITYALPQYTWSPTTALFTNAAATTAYTGNPTTVYAKPTATTTYTATATTAAGCTSSASVAVTVATPSTQTLATNDYVWRGTTNTAWSTASNWVKYDGAAYPVASDFPSATDNVFIPQNNTCVVSQPSIGTATVTVNTVYIEPSATVTGGSGTLDVKGNFTNNGTFTAGTGTVSFTGTAAQQVTGATTFYNLTQNNAAGLTLNNPVTVANNLTMTAGYITTSATNLLTIGNNAPATLTWTSGKVVGPMKRWMAATTNSGASSSLFPLGNATRKAQASIEYTTAPTTAGYLEAKFIATSPANAATNAYATLTDQFNYVLDNVVTEGYWEIKPSAANTLTDGAYTVTLEGYNFSLAASTNASYTDVRVIKSPDPHTSWILQGDHGTATQLSQTLPADFTVSRTGMSGYSFFAMAFPSAAPLPVELVSFAANCADNNTVSVNWTTASEHNSDYYTLEKSRDGIAWNILATKEATGNSTQLINYSVTDVAEVSGTVYYRLTQVDVDGASKMYDIVSTSCSSASELSLIAYPNPSNGQFTVKIENALGGKYDLAITDMQGKAIEEQTLQLETGTTVLKMNPVGLQPGVYLLQFMQDGKPIQQQKLIIE